VTPTKARGPVRFLNRDRIRDAQIRRAEVA
jgi:hypothetical protein